ncbi:sugar phosphate isomerase/epimerase family protein [Corynebacterium riegelii]|uniref:sugar phosphate isomerase/epimerase family protein n=1 Tax=Corynebacterium riegelii TaxID=156976 RepID=UPI0023F38AE3|nr:TIM barrel protein [Corynebacterium riegelii]
MQRHLGIAPLSSITTAPDRFVRLAGEAGFDFVGIRVRKVTDSEPAFDLSPGSPMLTKVLRALDETGLYVLDTEFLIITDQTSKEDWAPALEAAHALGAKTFTCTAGTTNQDRLVEVLSEISAAAKPLGIKPSLEPISYNPFGSLKEAADMASAAGAYVLPDTLHLTRFGAEPSQLAAYLDHFAMLQVCDCSATPPVTHDEYVFESRSGRLAPGDGGAALKAFVNAVPASLPVSVEAPNDAEVAKRGDASWINYLYEATKRLVEQDA